MKKYLFLILAATLFAACGGNGDGDEVINGGELLVRCIIKQ